MAQLAFDFTYMIGTMAGCQPIARKFFAKLDTRIVIVGGSAVVSMGGSFFNDLAGLPNQFGSIPVAAISIVPVLLGGISLSERLLC